MGRVSWRQRLRLFCWSTLASISAAVSFAVLSIAWAGDCPDGKPGSPRYTLRVAYEVRDFARVKTLKGLGAPVSARQPFRVVEEFRDGYKWRRETGKNWVSDYAFNNANIEGIMAGRIREKFKLVDVDSVDVKAPKWEFSYDKVARTGHKEVYSKPVVWPEIDRLWMQYDPGVLGESVMIAPSIRGRYVGGMSVAGTSCRLYRAAGRNPQEQCIANINGRNVILYWKWSSEDEPITQTATVVDPTACIGLSRFSIPKGIVFEANPLWKDYKGRRLLAGVSVAVNEKAAPASTVGVDHIAFKWIPVLGGITTVANTIGSTLGRLVGSCRGAPGLDLEHGLNLGARNYAVAGVTAKVTNFTVSGGELRMRAHGAILSNAWAVPGAKTFGMLSTGPYSDLFGEGRQADHVDVVAESTVLLPEYRK